MDSSQWQPIDNAPEDTEVLVYTPKWGAIIARRDAEHDAWLSRMQVPVTISDDEAPTHWQALPGTPEGADAAGREEDEDRPDTAAGGDDRE